MQLVLKMALSQGRFHNPLSLLNELSSYDVALWHVYDGLFAFGQFNTDKLIATVGVICHNMWKSKESAPITVDEMLGIAEPLTAEYVKATIRSFRGN